ncbi:choline dehydrogenase-like protein [Lojkania enalia]|uniref:Choline dehydrogenase-like protein n=1 Tax=Lojkania enalia TaxID=147567 RepID=A0A9P4N669_9PLEO|nr:choline dehydrogenase-like protein [Didymosphaeria enalia]
MALYFILMSALSLGVNSGALGRFARVVDETQLLTNGSYDFVVAGGGIAGLTVADRLSENPDVSILVIEYGPFDQHEDTVMVPGAWLPVPYLWLPLMSTPQTALGGTSYSVPCGQIVGGGSVVNAMFFHASSAWEYNAWEQMGATGWGWKSLLPYFKKSEAFNRPDPKYAIEHNITWDDSVHGFNGPVQISHAPYDYPGSANFYNAARSFGIRAPKDADAGDPAGIFRLQRAVDPKTQTRSSARINHYENVIPRPNYHILPNTAVGRVLFEAKTAIGVEYVNRTTTAKGTIKAEKEVIVAAGAVHTPQILQLSGIGPSLPLKDLGIKSIVDLPGVGQNLQDHLGLYVYYNYTNNLFPNSGSLQTNATFATEQRALYDAGRPSAFDITAATGNLFIALPLKNITSEASSIIALAKSQDPSKLLKDPDPTVLAGYKKQRNLLISSLHTSASLIGDISWSTGPATTLYMTRPLSRGSVTISSANVLADPLIDFGAATDPTDIEMLLGIYLKNRKLMAMPELAILGPIETSPAPGVADKDAIRKLLKANLQPSNAHMCCTAAMMRRADGGVVDVQNRVYGTERLSVVDNSVWPFILGSGPMASVYAGAEKAADEIKKRLGLL